MSPLTLGYPVENRTLALDGIIPNRTSTSTSIEELKKIAESNVADTLKILKWNHDNNIHLYRMSSYMFPNVLSTHYDIADIKGVNDLGTSHQRITFHPGQHVVLNSESKFIIRESRRELLLHDKLCDLARLDESIIVLHGGGVYGNKPDAIDRWIANFSALPTKVKNRIVLENDEYRYSLDDIIGIHNRIEQETGHTLPIVLDLFHYSINMGRPFSSEELLEEVLSTWTWSTPKVHISEQREDARRGAHAEYVREIPKILLDKGHNLHIMVEAGAREKALIFLRDKYSEYVI